MKCDYLWAYDFTLKTYIILNMNVVLARFVIIMGLRSESESSTLVSLSILTKKILKIFGVYHHHFQPIIAHYWVYEIF